MSRLMQIFGSDSDCALLSQSARRWMTASLSRLSNSFRQSAGVTRALTVAALNARRLSIAVFYNCP